MATAADDPDDLADAERRLGVRIPESVRALYADSDGRHDDVGQWWVVWPLERLIAENTRYWSEGWLSLSLLAFGDDGTGDPFCVYHGDPVEAVARWSMIEHAVFERYESMNTFVTTWLRPT